MRSKQSSYRSSWRTAISNVLKLEESTGTDISASIWRYRQRKTTWLPKPAL